MWWVRYASAGHDRQRRDWHAFLLFHSRWADILNVLQQEGRKHPFCVLILGVGHSLLIITRKQCAIHGGTELLGISHLNIVTL